ncbi:hypothetical protein EV193_10740 [Herbihabitans rhizosphaerae]|uniref:DUF6879 domain-containing protein n=2 Tax=Herbihabitans rhizosphaerae TaxID=1872711 RepID=A0A4Q7KIJ4_9PSEU|nr:DUF6879 family protein [Herbihabitans rhizosphaerae]RZS36359.1 hypothetical protein EV193_10740 [Herbihabitans rhizosphaerae]
MQSWLSMVKEATLAGRRFFRVRVVTLPLTDYSRFSLWGSKFTCQAGEDIYYLPRDQAADLPNHDYWLFDSSKLVKLNFDEQSTWLGGEIMEDPHEIVKHNYWRDSALHHAVRREDFAAEQSVQRY